MKRLLFALSVAVSSCAPQPMCDDPNAINYDDMNDFCEYHSAVHFYLSESTLELIQEYSPNSSNFNYIRLHSTQSNIVYAGFNFTTKTSLSGYNIQVPIDCNNYYYNSLFETKYSENIAGVVEELYVTIDYYNEDPIVIWEGEIHFDPSDPCKIIEVTYE